MRQHPMIPRWGRAVALTLTVMLAGGCAAELPRERRINKPAGRAEAAKPLALDKIIFNDLDTGEPFTLKDYMEREGMEHLLLMFGSKSCSVCTQKAAALRDVVLPRHFLFSEAKPATFDVIGISADNRHDARGVERYRLVNRFDFLRWADYRGAMLIEHFLPAGSKLSVPFTALVSRRGLVWTIASDEKLTMAEIADRVAATLGLEGTTSETGGETPEDSPEPSPKPKPASDSLYFATGDRLAGVKVKTCDGQSTTLGNVLPSDTLKIVQLFPSTCDDACRASHREMTRAATSCRAAARACAVVSLVPSESAASHCEAGMLTGGGELWAAFSSIFDWRHERHYEGLEVKLAPFTAPVQLVFDESGRLAFAHEGALPHGELARWLEGSLKTPRGPDFPLFDAERGTFSFADLRGQTDYTILLSFDMICEGCKDKLKKWSLPGGLDEVCRKSRGGCQTLALEVTPPVDQTPAEVYADVIGPVREITSVIPVVTDPTPLNAAFEGLDRIYEGYLTARFPEWRNGYGVVIYNREGQIIDQFRAADENGNPTDDKIIFNRVKQLLGRRG